MPVQFSRLKSGIAFVHDMANGWPEAMNKADVIYADIPWMHGYLKFYERAGRQAKTNYIGFLKNVGMMLRRIDIPAVIITGKHAIHYLAPFEYMPIRLNGDPSNACLWRITPDQFDNPKTEYDILNQLVKFYRCIGDPFCGYGRSGRVFAQAGRRFIMSDLNPWCIGYIAKEGDKWITT